MGSRLSPTGLVFLAAAILAAVAGTVVAAVADGSHVDAVVTTLFGIAAVLLVSLVFLLVGESEDRDRERDERRRARRRR